MVSVRQTADKSRPSPGALAQLVDVTDSDLRALLVGAALALPDLTGLLIAADRAAEAGALQVEHALRLMHATATGPLDPCEGFGRVTLARLLYRADFAAARAAVGGVTLGLLNGAFGRIHPAEGALVLFAGAGVLGWRGRYWRDEYTHGSRLAIVRAAGMVASDAARAHTPSGLCRVALDVGRWLSRFYASEGPSSAALLARLGVNVFVGAVRDTAGATLAELRELRIGRRHPD